MIKWLNAYMNVCTVYVCESSNEKLFKKYNFPLLKCMYV